MLTSYKTRLYAASGKSTTGKTLYAKEDGSWTTHFMQAKLFENSKDVWEFVKTSLGDKPYIRCSSVPVVLAVAGITVEAPNVTP